LKIVVQRGFFRWRFVIVSKTNGKVVAQSSGPRTYRRRADALATARAIAEANFTVHVL